MALKSSEGKIWTEVQMKTIQASLRKLAAAQYSGAKKPSPLSSWDWYVLDEVVSTSPEESDTVTTTLRYSIGRSSDSKSKLGVITLDIVLKYNEDTHIELVPHYSSEYARANKKRVMTLKSNRCFQLTQKPVPNHPELVNYEVRDCFSPAPNRKSIPSKAKQIDYGKHFVRDSEQFQEDKSRMVELSKWILDYALDYDSVNFRSRDKDEIIGSSDFKSFIKEFEDLGYTNIQTHGAGNNTVYFKFFIKNDPHNEFIDASFRVRLIDRGGDKYGYDVAIDALTGETFAEFSSIDNAIKYIKNYLDSVGYNTMSNDILMLDAEDDDIDMYSRGGVFNHTRTNKRLVLPSGISRKSLPVSDSYNYDRITLEDNMIRKVDEMRFRSRKTGIYSRGVAQNIMNQLNALLGTLGRACTIDVTTTDNGEVWLFNLKSSRAEAELTIELDRDGIIKNIISPIRVSGVRLPIGGELIRNASGDLGLAFEKWMRAFGKKAEARWASFATKGEDQANIVTVKYNELEGKLVPHLNRLADELAIKDVSVDDSFRTGLADRGYDKNMLYVNVAAEVATRRGVTVEDITLRATWESGNLFTILVVPSARMKRDGAKTIEIQHVDARGTFRKLDAVLRGIIEENDLANLGLAESRRVVRTYELDED